MKYRTLMTDGIVIDENPQHEQCQLEASYYPVVTKLMSRCFRNVSFDTLYECLGMIHYNVSISIWCNLFTIPLITKSQTWPTPRLVCLNTFHGYIRTRPYYRRRVAIDTSHHRTVMDNCDGKLNKMLNRRFDWESYLHQRCGLYTLVVVSIHFIRGQQIN